MSAVELTDEQTRFISEVLRKGVELEKKLPQVHLRLPLSYFLNNSKSLWHDIVLQIIEIYPQHSELLLREDLAFRTVFRPRNNNATLPGFDDKNINTRTLSLWYGMDYCPKVGEYVGMTRNKPWVFYMLPDPRSADSKQYHTTLYVYDNEGDRLVGKDQTTAGPVPKDNYLTDYIRMIINIGWFVDDLEKPLKLFVYDETLEDLKSLAIRLDLFKDC